MARKRLTRKKVNDPIVDTALRDIYDKIEHLMPETAGKASKTAPQIGDFQLVNNGDQTSLAQYTEEGWMVDMNSNYTTTSNSKDFRPSIGSTGKSRTPVKGEAVRYDRNKNIAITNDKQERILLNNIGNELSIRNANNTADVPIKAKAFKFTIDKSLDSNAQEIGNLIYDKDGNGSHVLNTSALQVTPLYTGAEKIPAQVLVQSSLGADATVAFQDGVLQKWVIGHDTNKTTTFTQANCVLNATATVTVPNGENFETLGSVGATVTGTGIPANTVVVAVSPGSNTFEMNNAAEDSATRTLTFTNNDGQFKINTGITLSDSSKFALDTSGNLVTAGTITDGSGNTFDTITKSIDNITAGTLIGHDVNITRAGNVSSGTDTITGIDLDMSTTGASGGTINSTGVDINMTGDTGGTSELVGLNINVSGADNNRGMVLRATGSGARQFVFEYDDDNYGTVFVNNTGVLRVEAVGASGSQVILEGGSVTFDTATTSLSNSAATVTYSGSGASYKSTLQLKGNQGYFGNAWRHFYIETSDSSATKLYNNADDTSNAAQIGDIEIESTKNILLDAAVDVILDPATGVTHFRDAGDTDDEFKITVVGDTGATTLETVSDAADGHLTLNADGDITLDAASGNIYVKDNGGNYTPGSDYEIATRKYVDDNAGSGGLNPIISAMVFS